MSKLILILISTISINFAFSKDIPISFDITGNELTISMSEDFVVNKPNAVKHIFKRLNLKESRPIEGVVEKKYVSELENFSIVCAEIKIEGYHYFTFTLKTDLTSTDDKVISSFPYGGYLIATTNQFARDLNSIFSGHPARCWKWDFADNFIIDTCPNNVSINVTPQNH